MIKSNKKGFFLSETMVVIAIVAVVLISVFKLFTSVYSSFEQGEKYDTANAITALANVQKYFESIEEIDTSTLSATTPYIDLTTTAKYDSEYYTRLKEEFQIDKVYLIDLNHTLNGNAINDFYVTLRKYIKTLRNVNGVVLVAVINDSEFASIKIENYGDVELIGDKDNEYAVYIPKNGEFIEPGYINWSGDAPTKTWEDGKELDTSKSGTYYLHYDFNGYMLRRKIVVGAQEGVTYLNHLYNTVAEKHGLIIDDTEDENLRYSGSTPHNYVEFNDELWRIVGVFDVKETASSTAAPRIKLIRDESIGNFSWDSSENSVNYGGGVNEWSEAYLNALLNNTYYNKTTSTTCYNGWNNAYTSCDFTSIGLGSTAKSMIKSVVWNTGGVNWSQGGVAKDSYTAERGTEQTGKECTSDAMYDGAYYCTDEVTRTTSYTDEIGLIYPSDYLYASKDNNCRTNGKNESNYCKNDNWLHTGDHYWLLSPGAFSDFSDRSWIAYALGRTYANGAGGAVGVRPSVYLKQDIVITEGQGTETNPYKLAIQ